MSIQVYNSPDWKEQFEDSPPVCFLCGESFNDQEKVIHWMGTGGEKLKELPLIPDDPQTLSVMDTLLKRGMWPALHIFFHTKCVPSFCRRVLMDWEETQGFFENGKSWKRKFSE
jgi:hypothetical protein